MHRLLRYLGSSFLQHLEIEKNRPAELLDTVTWGDHTPRFWIEQSYENLLEAFPDIKSWESVPRNIVREYNTRSGRNSYHNSSFEGFDVTFVELLKNLNEQTTESRERHKKCVLDLFSKFNSLKFGLDVHTILHLEAILNEVVREIVEELYEDKAERQKVWSIFMGQRFEQQKWLSGFFESILLESINENERLLHNILPIPIFEELKKNHKVEPKYIDSASVLFTDFAGFTKHTEKMPPSQLIKELDICFSRFDHIVHKYQLEKIKTIGDGYMCAGGIPITSKTHLFNICLAALEMREAIRELSLIRGSSCGGYWKIRIGIHIGPLVAGIIGEHKFSYDIWGDTVNIASRMESSGVEDGINVSCTVYKEVHEYFEMENRGFLPAKNKGNLQMFHLKRVKPKYSNDANGIEANAHFFDKINRNASARI